MDCITFLDFLSTSLEQNVPSSGQHLGPFQAGSIPRQQGPLKDGLGS